MGRSIACAGLLLAVFGWAFGHNCDFDTMRVCKPLGLFEVDAFNASGWAGLLMVAGGAIALLGMGMALLRRPPRKVA